MTFDIERRARAGIGAFFSPRSVAVVGASPGKLGYPNLVLRNLAAHGFLGEVTVINPNYELVDGVVSVPSLNAMPERPDLCVIGVRADLVPAILHECVAMRVPAVTVIASGFAEQGTQDGIALQREIEAIISGSATRLLGPNCLGIASFAKNAVSIASANIPTSIPAGPVAIVSQSGGVSLVLLLRGAAQGLGIGHLVSVGNELDVSVPELLETMAERDDVKVIVCYLEGVRNPAALRRAIEICGSAAKPVIILRGGQTTKGKAAAASHTGALAGDGAIWRGFVAQVGAIEAQSIDHAIALARIFARFGIAPGPNIGGFAGGGGLTVLFSDMLSRSGISTPTFTSETQNRIRTALPDVTPHNPMDMGGLFLSGDGSSLADALTAMSEDPAVDVLALCVPPYLEFRDRVVNGAIVRATASLTKPAIIVSYGVPGAQSVLKDADLFILEPPESGVEALRSWLKYRPRCPDLTDIISGGESVKRELTQHLASALAKGATVLLEDTGKELLKLYGVASPNEQIVADEWMAIAAAERLGYPVALKILSSEMLHRGVGHGVLLGLRNSIDVATAFRTLQANANSYVNARFLVQEMATPGLELLVGAYRDAEMGLSLAVGMGGANAEAAKEVLFFVPPISRETLRGLLFDWPALTEAERRRGGLDREALIEAICGIAAMLADGGSFVEELDVNPLIVGAPGEGAVAVDALFILRGTMNSASHHEA